MITPLPLTLIVLLFGEIDHVVVIRCIVVVVVTENEDLKELGRIVVKRDVVVAVEREMEGGGDDRGLEVSLWLLWSVDAFGLS